MQTEIETTDPKTGEITKLIEIPGCPPQVTILHRGQTLGPYTQDEVDLFLDLLLAYRRRRNPAFDTLLRAVAEHHHISATHLLDHSRGNHVVTARQAAMTMCSEFFQQDRKPSPRLSTATTASCASLAGRFCNCKKPRKAELIWLRSA